MKPRKYNMSDPEDLMRWFREMEGYLTNGYGEHKTFVNMGTDYEGRKFAFEAFREFRTMTEATLPLMTETMKKIKEKGEKLAKAKAEIKEG